MTEKAAEAAVRERETAEQLRRGGLSSGFEDLGRLADIWAAQHLEWQCVRDLMAMSSWSAYQPERDAQGARWAQERTQRREQALAARSAFEERQRGEADGLRALWLSAATSRPIRAAAERGGLRFEQVLERLAERATVGADGTVCVPSFTPSR
ncbi:hypothetical protein OG754_39665 [Streptomyces decoyicus]|uniref:hypothetical protein n=1 Tax=Streptomyces decoyicus TaxID=249567 RepID=UPI002E353CBE|nr:hypothetical protein [Streptomyces decoyicus]